MIDLIYFHKEPSIADKSAEEFSEMIDRIPIEDSSQFGAAADFLIKSTSEIPPPKNPGKKSPTKASATEASTTGYLNRLLFTRRKIF